MEGRITCELVPDMEIHTESTNQDDDISSLLHCPSKGHFHEHETGFLQEGTMVEGAALMGRGHSPPQCTQVSQQPD